MPILQELQEEALLPYDVLGRIITEISRYQASEHPIRHILLEELGGFVFTTNTAVLGACLPVRYRNEEGIFQATFLFHYEDRNSGKVCIVHEELFPEDEPMLDINMGMFHDYYAISQIRRFSA